MKQYDISYQGRQVSITLTPHAASRLGQARELIVIDAALYFSCLIKKICEVDGHPPDADACRVCDGLYFRFRTVMTRRCSLDEYDAADGVTEFSARHPGTWVPKWVALDFRHGRWQAGFGY